MISVGEMKKASGRKVKLILPNGAPVWGPGTEFIKYCTAFYQKEDEEEENMLEFDNILINQSEIEKLTIMD